MSHLVKCPALEGKDCDCVPGTPNYRKRKGFAKLSLEERQALGVKGGKAAHAKGVAHRFTVDEARVAGRKGGAASAIKREREAVMGRKEAVAAAKARRVEQ